MACAFLMSATQFNAATRVHILNQSTNETYIAEHGMTDRQVQMILAGSLINPLAGASSGTQRVGPPGANTFM